MFRFKVAPALVAGAFIAGSFLTPARAAMSDAAMVQSIDTECNAIQNAVMALKPVHAALVSGKWVVMNDGDYTAAVRTNASLTFADVYKQGKNYAWVHAHTVNQQGAQRATQLCFRQSDGSLARARQATTVPQLAAASAKQAFYAPNGKIIQKTSIFEANDPMLAKAISALPFYAVLPK